MIAEVQKIIDNFTVSGTVTEASKYGSGHINDTRYLVLENECGSREYILQRINKNVFKNPVELMENFVKVTDYLANVIRARNGDPERETLTAIRTKDGSACYCDENGEYWRLVYFITDSLFCQ